MTITYNKFWDDYTHNGALITNLELFIATALKLGKTVEIEITEGI